MTEEFTPIEILKIKQNFSSYIESHSDEIVSELLQNYPKRGLHIIIPQLTPSAEGLIDGLEDLRDSQEAYVFWFIVNEKEKLTNIAQYLNNVFSKNYGMFIIKAYLNGDKIDFKCILKPQSNNCINKNTHAKNLQFEYWKEYFIICDKMQSLMQVTPGSQHWQYIPMGRRGVCLMLTASSQKKYVGVDLVINYDKSIFEQLYKDKNKIEKELGELDWINIAKNKSCKIRKIYPIDLENRKLWNETINKHIEMAENFDKTFKKYLRQ